MGVTQAHEKVAMEKEKLAEAFKNNFTERKDFIRHYQRTTGWISFGKHNLQVNTFCVSPPVPNW